MSDEVLNTSDFPKVLNSFQNQSVVFMFNGGLAPVACTLPFLYASKTETISVPYENSGLGSVGLENASYDTIMVTLNKMYQFYRVVQSLKFEYGLAHEYYKNSSGIWIDMIALRRDAGINYINDYALIGQQHIYDDTLAYNTYVRLADSKLHFDGNSTSILDQQYIVSKNKIPAVDMYIVNEDDDKPHIGSIHSIEKYDGSVEFKELHKIMFEKKGYYSYDEQITDITDHIQFTEKLVNFQTGEESNGSFESNNNHKFDDLKVSFFTRNGEPYTDVDNLLCFANGLCVDYIKSSNIANTIYIQDIVKFSDIQDVGVKTGTDPKLYFKNMVIGNENRMALDFDIEETKLRKAMVFNLRFFKWDNVKISHRIEPINIKKILKTEDESSNTFWLPTSLVFSNVVNPDKSILICNNEIVLKSEWKVDPNNSNIIELTGINAEFNLLYMEMKLKLTEYLEQMLGSKAALLPTIDSYLMTASTKEEIDTAFEKYTIDMTTYIDKANSGEYGYYDIHSPLSAIAIVKNEFINRSFYLVSFDTIKETANDIAVVEDKSELILDRPYIDRLRNNNWKLDDLIIINGINHSFENEYDNVFKVPTTYWRPVIKNVFNGANAYKFKIVNDVKK